MTTVVEESDFERDEEDYDEEDSDDEIDDDEEGGVTSEEESRVSFRIPDFVRVARDMQNLNNSNAEFTATGARLFKEFFGTSLFVIEILWEMLVEDNLLPENGEPRHLLWTLFFLKTYPKQALGCSVVGASAGAVDPKTMKKWVWDFIDSIGELVDDVVSTRRLYYFIY